MNYLIKPDYLKHIQSDNLTVITDGNDAYLDECEAIAIEEIKSYISSRYDVETIFADIPEFDVLLSYAIGNFVTYLDVIYKCNVATTPGNLPTDTNFWSATDERSAKMVSIVVDLSLYHLHSRINPRNIPDLRGIRRDDAVRWLTETRDLKNNPSFLPVLDANADGVDGLKIKWGSNDITTNSY